MRVTQPAQPAPAQPAPSQPPSAPALPYRHTNHGVHRDDPWHWLGDASNPDVVAYLEAENSYAESVLAPTRDLQGRLFEGIRSRTQESDAGPPSYKQGWWYYTRTEQGLQHPIECRLSDENHDYSASEVAQMTREGHPGREQVILDANRLAGAEGYLEVGILDVSPDGRFLAYGVDVDGSELYTVRFCDLLGGQATGEEIPGCYYSSAWTRSADGFFYVKPDASMRPWQVWCHRLGDDPAEDLLVFEELDERFYVEVSLSRSEQRIVIATSAKTSSEVHWLDTSTPPGTTDPQVLLGRRAGVLYEAEHDGDSWLLAINLTAQAEPAGLGAEPSLWRVTETVPSPVLRPVVAPRDDSAVVGVDAFEGFCAVTERSTVDGLETVTIITRDGRRSLVVTPEAPYTLMAASNPDWHASVYRYGYSSFVTPRTWVDHDAATGESDTVWVQKTGDGFDPDLYRVSRLWALGEDSTRIPISVACRADHKTDATAAGIVYGYGAYEMAYEASFSPANLNLLDRGVVVAIAHVRGGGELGRRWHEAGRMERKANTFSDFVACTRQLVADGWISPGRVAARGASAGGLLMGAVTNMRPDLFRVVVAEVPFVDVVTTMSNPELPLTVTEWEEWGDPLHDAGAYTRMSSYSPYDNVPGVVDPDGWPAMYVTAGLNDPRVGFWEPAKWVARLRSAGAGSSKRPVVLVTEMVAGHMGPSGRYEAWRDEAKVQAFILTHLDVGDSG